MTLRFPRSALVLGLLAAGLARPADAAHMSDCDMASLWHLADIVVEGQEQGYKTENHWEHGALFVTKVHKGADRVKAGDTIQIALMTYIRKLPFSDDAVETNDVLMFLKWNETGDTYRPAKRYLPVPTGIKLIKDDVVYRFEQFNNPGPYQPVRQGPEWIPRDELKTRKTTPEIDKWKELNPAYWESHAYVYDRAALRKDLALAAERVERLTAAIDAKDLDKLASFLPVTIHMGMTAYFEDGSGNVINTPDPVIAKNHPGAKKRIFVRRTFVDALAQDAAEALVKHADRARIGAILAEHKDKLTYNVRRTLEAGAPGG